MDEWEMAATPVLETVVPVMRDSWLGDKRVVTVAIAVWHNRISVYLMDVTGAMMNTDNGPIVIDALDEQGNQLQFTGQTGAGNLPADFIASFKISRRPQIVRLRTRSVVPGGVSHELVDVEIPPAE